MLYTGNGDKGTTTRFGSTKNEYKDSVLFSVLGHFDELNAYLGVVKTHGPEWLLPELTERQHELFVLQAELGGSQKKVSKNHIAVLEERINEIEKKLPPITSFILSGGVIAAAQLDYARTIARRAERATVALSRKEEVSEEVLSYVNRLSSYLFALSREVNARENVTEESPHY